MHLAHFGQKRQSPTHVNSITQSIAAARLWRLPALASKSRVMIAPAGPARTRLPRVGDALERSPRARSPASHALPDLRTGQTTGRPHRPSAANPRPSVEPGLRLPLLPYEAIRLAAIGRLPHRKAIRVLPLGSRMVFH